MITLTDEAIARAHNRLVAFDLSTLNGEELIATSEDIETELLLHAADLEARDFTRHPEPILKNVIAHLQSQLGEVTYQLERRKRTRLLMNASGVDASTALEPRWAAVRALNIVHALQTLGLPLQKRGREHWARCPFHSERSPSFAVNEEKGVWHCHGCGLGGDLIRFIQEREHLSPVGALRFAETFLAHEVAA